MKILIVGSDLTLAHNLQSLTASHALEVECDEMAAVKNSLENSSVSSGKAAFVQYDLIVIEAAEETAEPDSISLCQQLRAQNAQTLILLIIEPGNSRQAIAALDAGANDYLIKPFDAQTLITRAEVLGCRELRASSSREASGPVIRPVVGPVIGPVIGPVVGPVIRPLENIDKALSLAVEGISQLDVAGRYLFVNDAYARMVGYLPSEMVGRDWQRTVHPDDRPLMLEAYQQMLAEGQVEVEARGLRKDGSIFDKRLTMVSAYDHQRKFVGHYCFMKDVSDRKQTETKLQQQLQRAQLTTQIMDAIRQTLDLGQILHTAVEQVRNYLKTDRVIVFRFNPNWQGIVEAESVGPGLTKTLGMKIQDLCFGKLYADSYRQGRVSAIPDLHTADIDSCHVELLSAFEVQANLVVPILQGEKLWGLLIAHHCCGPRQWEPESTQLLQQVATQMGIALHQAGLYQRNRKELIERRQIQAALAQSEERFRSLSAFAPVGIYETDIDGQCTYTNARWQEIAGLTFVESLGDRWVQAIHPDDKARVFAAWTQLVNGESDFELEYRFLTRRGEEHWVLGRAIPMHSNAGEVVGYVGVNEDITQRKLAEQQIRQQAALIDIASDAIFVRDFKDSRIIFWSKGATQLYGWSADEVMGKVAHELFNKSRAEIQDAMNMTIKHGSWQGELSQRTKTGDEILVASRWTLIEDEYGQPQSLLTVNTDITDKKQLEAQFYEAQRLESLGRLAGGIAHDLGNVLTPILGIAQLLRITQTDADGSTQEQLDILEKSAKRGAKMVRQILTFAQGSSEEKTTVDIDALLQEVIDVVRQGFPSTIEIRQAEQQIDGLLPNDSRPNDTKQRPKEVSADSTHLHQVFMNLCINARDAMPKGGVLTLSVEHCFIDEALAKKTLEAAVGDYVVVSVSDTGVGIPPELRDRIFDPFFTTKGPDKGTGLGLATVSGIVKKMSGFLKVFSEVGQGTQVSVYLPAVSARTESSHLSHRTTHLTNPS